MDTLFNLSIINKVHLQIDKLQSKLVMLDPNYVYTRWPGPDFYCIHCTMWLWTSYYTWLQPFGQEDPKSPQSKTRFEKSLPSWWDLYINQVINAKLLLTFLCMRIFRIYIEYMYIYIYITALGINFQVLILIYKYKMQFIDSSCDQVLLSLSLSVDFLLIIGRNRKKNGWSHECFFFHTPLLFNPET